MKTRVSEKLFEEAINRFPGGVNSPVRAFRSVGGTPLFISRGKGAYVWDADNNKYIDFCCSWGPLILGHASREVEKTVIAAVKKGTTFGAPTRLENELASLILSNNKYLDKIRFVSSGTEAVMSALRLARAYTKRNKILKFEGCYHGHADAMLVKAGSGLVTLGNPSSAGIPESVSADTIVVHLDDKAALQRAFEQNKDQIAAVIIEPIPANNGLLIQKKDYLKFLRDICSTNKTLLIFDEVISGFRIGFEGASGHYGIRPDLVTFGKIIGGGFPVGAYGGKAEIMEMISPSGPVYQAGTLSGNPVAMSAGIAQLKQCLKKNFYDDLDRKCEDFKGRLLAKKIVSGFNIQRIGSIFWLHFGGATNVTRADQISDQSMRPFRKMYHLLLNQGVYLGPSGYEVGFISRSHSQRDIAKAANAVIAALHSLGKS
jgi:glutamate-1-semialdehyde 2,1-aminomutase